MELKTIGKQIMKEHVNLMYNDGDDGWSDYSEDFGEFNEVIEDVEEDIIW